MVRLHKEGHILFCMPCKMWGRGGKRSPREEQQAQECYKPASLCQASIKPELQLLSLSASQQYVDLISVTHRGTSDLSEGIPTACFTQIVLPLMKQVRTGGKG